MSDMNLTETLQKVEEKETSTKLEKRLISGHCPEVQQVRIIAASQDGTI